MIAFTVPGAPQGKGRARSAVRYGRDGKPIMKDGRVIVGHHTPAKTEAYESLISMAAHQAMRGGPLLLDAAGCNIFIDAPIPASWSAKKQRMALAGEVLPTTKPDADNVVKAVFDGLNGVVWRDDVQVVDLRVRKRYAAVPCVRVEVLRVAQPLAVQAQLLEAVA